MSPPTLPFVLIRADASARIGIGHVRRCLTLARALTRRGCAVRFAVREGGAALASLLAEFWNDAILLPASDDAQHDQAAWPDKRQRADVDAIVRSIGAARPSCVVVDHYGLDATWHEGARSAWGGAIVAIDDLANRPLAADLVLDVNWAADHRAKYKQQLTGSPILLGGPHYALIDEKFAAEPRGTANDAVGSIGIFMGGTDPAQANRPILLELRRLGFANPIEIVSTSLNPGLAELKAAIAADDAGELTLDTPDLFDFFRRHDLFVLAAGGTTWERMASAAPAIAIVTASNQRAIADELSENGLQWTAIWGDWAAFSDLVTRALSDPPSRIAMARSGRSLVDGRGAERVAQALLTLGDAPFSARRADMGDVRRIFDWRNDPAIRAVSRDSEALDFEAHRNWFTATLVSPDRLLLIVEKGNLPVGTVRFDRRSDAAFELSIFTDPMLTGLRLGDGLVAAAHAYLTREMGRHVEIVAETLPNNRASQKLFLRAGYRQEGNLFRLSLPRLSAPEDGVKS